MQMATSEAVASASSASAFDFATAAALAFASASPALTSASDTAFTSASAMAFDSAASASEGLRPMPSSYAALTPSVDPSLRIVGNTACSAAGAAPGSTLGSTLSPPLLWRAALRSGGNFCIGAASETGASPRTPDCTSWPLIVLDCAFVPARSPAFAFISAASASTFASAALASAA